MPQAGKNKIVVFKMRISIEHNQLLYRKWNKIWKILEQQLPLATFIIIVSICTIKHQILFDIEYAV